MKIFFLGVCLVFTAAFADPAPAADSPHAGLSTYEGPKTCAGCHPGAAREVAGSLHYQMAAEPVFLEGWPKGKKAGMMLSY